MASHTRGSRPQKIIPDTTQWRAELSTSWNVLGPFPIHAREQHFLSPSFPLDLSKPIDFSKTWPSSYADGGNVSWGKATSDKHGNLKVSYPHIRWENIRATEGWAGLQHHSVLRTTVIIYPPSDTRKSLTPPNLRVELLQGSFFTILPRVQKPNAGTTTPKWYSGNIYALERAPLQTISLPSPPSTNAPTHYDVFVSGDYEIRLFGDPTAYNSKVPILSINFSVDVEHPTVTVVREPKHDIVCDFVDGVAFGQAIGVGLRSIGGWWTVTSVAWRRAPSNKSLSCLSEELSDEDIDICLANHFSLAPTQTGVVPIILLQKRPTKLKELPIDIVAICDTATLTISFTLPIVHRPSWSPTSNGSIKATYFFAETMPTAFFAMPPKSPNVDPENPRVPILALHGAGVDILEHAFWQASLPRQEYSWIIMPTGRTSWGLDWHGPSAQDAWDTLGALHNIILSNKVWKGWVTPSSLKVALIGHSNGGQGAWYLAARYPDRVVGVVPAAGYIKSQAYVPMTMSRSAHFIDPSLRAILESSLTPDDNDIFLSNLADMPILAIHGGNDDNVPTWHTREAVSILRTWNPAANVIYREDAGQPHWYPSVFKNEQVVAFLDSVTLRQQKTQLLRRELDFTLTVAIPAESGSLHGWRILDLQIPGRLARLHIVINEAIVHVDASNVRSMSVSLADNDIEKVYINGALVLVPKTRNDSLCFHRSSGSWKVEDANFTPVQHFGRLQSILNSAGCIYLVIPNKEKSAELSVALRIAHDLIQYHNIATELLSSVEAVERHEREALSRGNVVVIGGTNSPFVMKYIEEGRCSFTLSDGAWMLSGRKVFDDSSSAFVFSQRSWTSKSGSMLFLMANDQDGLERAIRIFPVRTGCSTPDWISLGATTDKLGAAGIRGAGVWRTESCLLAWNEYMSWLN